MCGSSPFPPPPLYFTQAAVFDGLCTILAQFCKGSDAKLSASSELVSLGLDSVDMTAIAQGITKKFGIKTSPMLVMEAENLGELASAVVAKGGGPAASSAKPKEKKSRAPRAPRSSAPRAAAPAASQAASAEDVLVKVMGILGKFAKNAEAIQLGTELVDLGLDSVDMTAIAQEVGKAYGIKVTPMVVMEANTVGDLVESIVAKGASVSAPSAAAAAAAPASSGRRRKVPREGRSGGAAPAAAAPAAQLTLGEVTDGVRIVVQKFTKGEVAPNPETELVSLGLDSVDMTAIAQQLSKQFGTKLSPMVVMEAENLNALAQAIVEKLPKQAAPSAKAAAASSSKRSSRQAAVSAPRASSGDVVNSAAYAKLKAEKEALQTEKAVRDYIQQGADNDMGWTVGILRKLAGVIVLAMGFFVSALGANQVSDLRDLLPLFMPILQWPTCHLSLGDVIATHFVEVLWRIGLFLSVLFIGLTLWVIIVKWVILGRVVPGRFHKNSLYAMRRDIVNMHVDIIIDNILSNIIRDTQLMVYITRMLGASIGKNVWITQPITRDFDLIHVGDGSTLLGNLEPTLEVNGFVCEHRLMYCGANTNSGRHSVIGPGAQLGQSVSVCVGSHAQGVIPSGSTVYDEKVLPPGTKLPHAIDAVCAMRPAKTTLFLTFLHLIALGVIVLLLCTGLSLMLLLLGTTATNMVYSCVADRSGKVTVAGFSMYLDVWSIATIAASPLILGLVFTLVTPPLKWILMGKFKVESFTVTSWYAAKHYLFMRLVMLAESLFVLQYYRHTPIMFWFYRALGCKLTLSAVYSAWIDLAAPDLVEVGEDAYFGFGPFVPCVSVDPTTGLATFEKTVFKDKAFVGPGACVLPGAVMEKMSACSAMAAVGRGTLVKTGTLHMGSGMKIAYKPDYKLGNSYVFGAYLTFLFTFIRLPIDCVLNATYLPAVILPLWLTQQGMPAWMTYPGLVTSLAISMLTWIPIVACIPSILLKWLLLGRPKDGDVHPWRGFHHANWVLVLASSLASCRNLQFVFEFTCVMTWFMQLRGAKVGKGVRVGMTFMTPENDLIEFQDGAYCDKNFMVYAHNFAFGHLKYEKSVVGRAVQACSHCHCCPGVNIPDGARLAPTALVLPRDGSEAGAVMIGKPAKMGKFGPGHVWICDNTKGVIPYSANLDPYDTSLLRANRAHELNANALEEGVMSMSEVQRRRRSGSKKKSLTNALLRNDANELSEEEMGAVSVTNDATDVCDLNNRQLAHHTHTTPLQTTYTAAV